MCGIAGIYLKNGEKVHKSLLADFSAQLAHRGPDGEGFFLNENSNVGLVHRRLSIIDVEGGAQPISDAGDKISIVGNGEIYNFVELQKQLNAVDVSFKTNSDIETALHLYKQYGIDFAKHLRGMYALAIYDSSKDELILARDPFGIKPLYIAEVARDGCGVYASKGVGGDIKAGCIYTDNSTNIIDNTTSKSSKRENIGIAFASEPTVLTKSGLVKPQVNIDKLPAFLNRQYVGGTETLFAGITRLKAGEVVIIKDGKITQRQVFSPFMTNSTGLTNSTNVINNASTSSICTASPTKQPPHLIAKPAQCIQQDNEAKNNFSQLFSATVKLHLQSEVPYGAFVSGGIDSSALLLEMAEQASPIRTFTVGFSSKNVADERQSAQELTAKLVTNHSGITFSEADFWQYLPQMCTIMDDPVADYAALPLLKLAEHAAQDVKVILSGEGGDEFFAGYGRYKRSFWQGLVGRPFRGHGEVWRYKNMFQKAITDWQEEEISPNFGIKKLSNLQKLQARDITDWLPDDLLTKVDRCLMAYGIEGRVPFVDSQLSAFAFNLPDKLKMRKGKGKWLLKAWLQEKLDALGLDGQQRVWGKKQGFTVPIADYLENRRADLTTYMVGHKALGNIVKSEEFQLFMFRKLNKKSAKLLFTLLCYCLWFDIHIAGEKPRV